MYHTIARGGADSEQNGIFCAYCWRTHSSSATNSTFATMRAKISVGTHYAVNHMVGGLKFLFDFLNSQTRQTNGSFKSCNSHINACRDAASTESKCLYSWLDSGMQIWDQQPELWRRRGSWKYQRVSNVGVYRCHGETEPSSNRCWPRQSLDLSAEKYIGGGKRTQERDLHWQGYWSLYSCLWHNSAEGWTTAISGLFYTT